MEAESLRAMRLWLRLRPRLCQRRCWMLLPHPQLSIAALRLCDGRKSKRDQTELEMAQKCPTVSLRLQPCVPWYALGAWYLVVSYRTSARPSRMIYP